MSLAFRIDKQTFRVSLLGLYTIPPPPKTHSGMTARQYRAARREYDRLRRADREINRFLGWPGVRP
jgi:hypothetical protein